jgi:hypothetical protein
LWVGFAIELTQTVTCTFYGSKFPMVPLPWSLTVNQALRNSHTILDARILDFGLQKPSGGNGFNL